MVRWMRSVKSALVLLLGLTVAVVLQAQPAAAEPTGQISNVQYLSGQVQFQYTVSGVPVGTRLDANAIKVSLGGTALQATVQAGTAAQASSTGPRSAVLVMDLSGSMAGARIAAARVAATSYVQSLPSDVRIGLVTFSDAVHVLVAPTTNRSAVVGAIGGLQAGGNTALYDALGQAIHAAAASAPGGQARLLVLSDGGDNMSKLSLAAVSTELNRSGVAADFVAFGSDADQSVLGRLASAGRGRMLAVSDTSALRSAFGAAAQNFSQQVLITAMVPASLAGSTGQLQVTLAVAGGQSISAGQSFSVPALSVAQPSTTTHIVAAAAPATRWLSTPLVLGLTFAGLLFLALMLLHRPSGTKPAGSHRQRMAELDRYRLGSTPATRDEAPARSLTDSVLGFTDNLIKSRKGTATVAANLDRGGIKLRPQEWLILRLAAVTVLVLTFFLMSSSLLLALPLGGLLGWLATMYLLKFKVRRRCAAFANQLPDVLQLVASSLRSGFSLQQALDAIVREGTEPASSEFSRAIADGRLGMNIEDSLENVATRMECTDLSWVVMAIRISREVGGNLAEVLMTTVGTMRERNQIRRQVKALSAEGRLSGMILVALPIFIALFLVLTRPAYLRPLYTDPLGWVMLGGATISMVIGTFWMSKIVKIEV